MVAYLKKPTGSEGFQEIVDFLNGSHIRYALTKNPTIYVSLIEKFWQTATVRTVDNEEQEINATVDGKEFTITKAFVRRHLQLADVDEPIPNIESTSPQKTQSPRQALNKDTELPQTSVPIPNVPDEVVHQERGDSVERAATTATSLEALQDSINIAKTQSTATPTKPISFERASKLSYDSPLGGGNTPRSDEDSMTLQELTTLCTKLSDRVLALETDLRQTKKVYGTAYTKLIMKVKKLEKTIKTSQARRRAKIVVSDDDMASEDSSKQGRMKKEIDQDVGVTLVTPTKVSNQEDQPEDQLGVLSTSYELKQRQERVGYEAAIRLQEQLDKEESQRIVKDAEDIKERVEADDELTQKLQVEEKDKYSEVDQARMLVDLINQRKRYFAAQKAEAKRNKPMTQAQ
ncbi:hypothetical protein Tco_0876424 [Tanacetum coccineum]|uniref:Xylulose kinase-1 n=1 Tax=Tanacetum coccineum TaxID=301880 RepID=A0ABQ5BVQ2_9ASTR